MTTAVSRIWLDKSGLNRLQIEPGLSGGNSLLSELWGFHALGLTPNDVALTEGELRTLSNGSTIPELVTSSGVSVEVKRIPSLAREAGVPPIRKRGRYSQVSWHFAGTVSGGLQKMQDPLIDAIFRETGLRVRRHILVLVVPEEMPLRHRERIARHAEDVRGCTKTAIPSRIIVATAPSEAF